MQHDHTTDVVLTGANQVPLSSAGFYSAYSDGEAQLEAAFRRFVGLLEQARTAMKAMRAFRAHPDVALRVAAEVMIDDVKARAQAAREAANYADTSVARKRDADRAHDLEQVATDLQSIIDRGHCVAQPEVAA